MNAFRLSDTIIVTVLASAMYPPAVSTSMLFAFQNTKVSTLELFLTALLLLVLIVRLQRTSLCLIKRNELDRKADKDASVPHIQKNARPNDADT